MQKSLKAVKRKAVYISSLSQTSQKPLILLWRITEIQRRDKLHRPDRQKDSSLDEKCGYFGERLVLRAQELGLNTCWVAMTYRKVKIAFAVDEGEKLCVVIALGYGEPQGVPHKSKALSEVAKVEKTIPGWFKNGIEAALRAPTAMNQQKFLFTPTGGKVCAKAGKGFYTKLDLGIVKYHFETGAGKDNFTWA